MNTREIHISDYNYPLPDERIAKFPLPQRDSSKLLVYRDGDIEERVFREIPDLLPQGALMVFNNTRVIQARLHFRKDSGALIEIFLLEPAFPVEYQENFLRRGSCAWYCLVGNLKKWKEGTLRRTIQMGDRQVEVSASRGALHGTSHRIEFQWDEGCSFAEVLEAMGELPIPPYLNRETQESDKQTYQTVYGKVKGSVAAPTAGLHFTERVLADLDAKGIEREELTLHVGAGTFKPVKSEEIGGHEMHTEHIAVRRSTIERLLAHEGHAIAVGTTSVRTLESLYYMGIKAHLLPPREQTGGGEEGPRKSDSMSLCPRGGATGELQKPLDAASAPTKGSKSPLATEGYSALSDGGEELHIGQWMPYDPTLPPLSVCEALTALLDYMDRHRMEVLHSSTQIIIAPGYEYKVVRTMVTNFHQPQSTLLLLVSAFVGGQWRPIYDYALQHAFRFLSYGDSCLLNPHRIFHP